MTLISTSDQKKRLMLVHHASEISGAEMSLELLLKGLSDRYEILLVLPREKGPFFNRIKDLNIQIELLPLTRFKRTLNPLTIGRYLILTVFCWGAIFRLIRRHRIAVVHANATTAHIFSCVPAALSGTPCIWHVRDSARIPVLGKFLKRLSSKILCVSESVASIETFNSAKTIVIPNALDANAWLPDHTRAFRKVHGLSADDLLIAQVGQLIPWKNHRDFILASALVTEKYKKVKFLIVGSDLFGNSKIYQEELSGLIAEKGLADFFIFLPYTENVRGLLSEVDILCHPALNEPFGRVIIEAMGLKKPVVAFESGGPSGIIVHGESGFLAKAGDVHGMAGALLDLLNSKALREKTGEAARSRVEKKYNITEQLVKIENVYTELTH